MKSDIREAMESYNSTATLWFGIHKGKPLEDVPVDYLKWVKTTDQFKSMSRSLQKAIKFQINTRK